MGFAGTSLRRWNMKEEVGVLVRFFEIGVMRRHESCVSKLQPCLSSLYRFASCGGCCSLRTNDQRQ